MSADRPETTEDDRHDASAIVPSAARRSAGSLTLTFEGGKPCALATFPLGDVEAVTIGRASMARAATVSRVGRERRLSLELADRRMSLVHAQLRRLAGAWIIEDARSKNGTRVNGLEIEQATLRPGDLVEVGRSFLVFRADASPAASEGPSGLVTANPALARQFEKLRALARSSVAIIVTGETGTGKELIARAIHELSGRDGPLRAVNCGALPRALLESELFGYRRGAFSGALEDRPGLVRSADRGTLFLDEIGDLPLDGQAALLRVLQEGEVVPIGGVKPIPVDVRLVVATHFDLAAMTAADRFRADLLARLAGFTIVLPPLRERREDLGALVHGLISRHAPERLASIELSAPAIRALHAHAWPANIRELEKALRTALILSAGEVVEVDHFPEMVRAPAAPLEPTAVAAMSSGGERQDIERLLSEHKGNVSEVARELRTSRTHVHRLCERLGIDVRIHRVKPP